jgi:hypothetical protein
MPTGELVIAFFQPPQQGYESMLDVGRNIFFRPSSGLNVPKC